MSPPSLTPQDRLILYFGNYQHFMLHGKGKFMLHGKVAVGVKVTNKITLK